MSFGFERSQRKDKEKKIAHSNKLKYIASKWCGLGIKPMMLRETVT